MGAATAAAEVPAPAPPAATAGLRSLKWLCCMPPPLAPCAAAALGLRYSSCMATRHPIPFSHPRHRPLPACLLHCGPTALKGDNTLEKLSSAIRAPHQHASAAAACSKRSRGQCLGHASQCLLYRQLHVVKSDSEHERHRISMLPGARSAAWALRSAHL